MHLPCFVRTSGMLFSSYRTWSFASLTLALSGYNGSQKNLRYNAVPDPDLEIRGRRSHPDPYMKGGGGSPPNFVSIEFSIKTRIMGGQNCRGLIDNKLHLFNLKYSLSQFLWRWQYHATKAGQMQFAELFFKFYIFWTWNLCCQVNQFIMLHLLLFSRLRTIWILNYILKIYFMLLSLI